MLICDRCDSRLEVRGGCVIPVSIGTGHDSRIIQECQDLCACCIKDFAEVVKEWKKPLTQYKART